MNLIIPNGKLVKAFVALNGRNSSDYNRDLPESQQYVEYFAGWNTGKMICTKHKDTSFSAHTCIHTEWAEKRLIVIEN